MKPASQRARQYREVETLSAAKHTLVVKLYDKLLIQMKKAQANLEIGARVKANEDLMKANEIVIELLGSLDKEQGGEIADHLAALYAYFSGEILGILGTSNRERLARLIITIEPLAAAWREAAQQVEAGTGK